MTAAANAYVAAWYGYISVAVVSGFLPRLSRLPPARTHL
jgi:hypothetical protein